VLAGRRLDPEFVGRDGRAQPLLVPAEAEEPVRLLDDLDRRLVLRTPAVDEIAIRVEGLAADAVPAGIAFLIKVAAVRARRQRQATAYKGAGSGIREGSVWPSRSMRSAYRLNRRVVTRSTIETETPCCKRAAHLATNVLR